MTVFYFGLLLLMLINVLVIASSHNVLDCGLKYYSKTRNPTEVL